MQSAATIVVSHFTRQLRDRVLQFESKLERTIVPPFEERARLASSTGWDSPELISEVDRALTNSMRRNVPSARKMFERDAENVRQFGNKDPLDILSGTLDKLFSLDNIPPPSHPLFQVCLTQTYSWASSVVDHWPEVRGSKERFSAVQQRADDFLRMVTDLRGVDRVAALELHSRFIIALNAPVPRRTELDPLADLTIPQRLWHEAVDFGWQTAFILGLAGDHALSRQGAWMRERKPTNS